MQRVLITGAAGRLGRVLRAGLARPDRILRLIDIADLGTAAINEELRRIDATELDAVVPLMDGVDIVLHLAAYPEEASWEQIFPLNYALTYAVLEAARRAGVKRFVFASCAGGRISPAHRDGRPDGATTTEWLLWRVEGER